MNFLLIQGKKKQNNIHINSCKNQQLNWEWYECFDEINDLSYRFECLLVFHQKLAVI